MYDSIVSEDSLKLTELIKKQQEINALIVQYAIENCVTDLSKLQEQILNITELTLEILNRFRGCRKICISTNLSTSPIHISHHSYNTHRNSS